MAENIPLRKNEKSRKLLRVNAIQILGKNSHNRLRMQLAVQIKANRLLLKEDTILRKLNKLPPEEVREIPIDWVNAVVICNASTLATAQKYALLEVLKIQDGKGGLALKTKLKDIVLITKSGDRQSFTVTTTPAKTVATLEVIYLLPTILSHFLHTPN